MMKLLSQLGMKTRFTRRSRFQGILTLVIVSAIVLCAKNLLNNYQISNSISNISFIQLNISTYVSNNQFLVHNKESKMVKQRPSLIYRPSSQLTILRALLLFFPNDQVESFQSEFRWFYRSWIEMTINESTSWRTDLIVYASEFTTLFEQLNCVYDRIRTDRKETPKCRVFPYVRIKDRPTNHQPSSKYQIIDQQRSQSLFQHLRTYGYIDSINTVFEYNSSFSMYDFILRTDMDCFLTQNFGLYVPYNNTLLVGHGGYSTEFTNKRLKRIADDMKWKYADRTSLGSTWYGPAGMTHRIADYTIQAMIHLVLNEFTTPEREQKLGVLLWPEWHFGVLLLYGGHLAINHLIASENLPILLANQLLDQGVASKNQTDIKQNLRLHLHCWHGSEPFSKFDFKLGKYNHIEPSTLLSDTSASGYAMRMALESDSMTLEQLKEKFLAIKK